MEHEQVSVPAGRIAYREAGSGSPIVFLHGLLVNGRLWRNVVAPLADDFRCLVPDLPLGSHQRGLAPDADLSPPGIADLVVTFLDELELESVTVVGNDSGGALAQVLAVSHPERVDRLVLTNCDAFDNFLPRRYRYLQAGARLPGFVFVLAQCLRSRTVARGPLGYGPLTTEGIPDEVLDGYTTPLRREPGVRRDLRAVLRGISARYTLDAAAKFPDFDRPVALAWGTADRVFPLAHARRLRDTVPDATLHEIEGGATFLPEDRPVALAHTVREFVLST